MSLRGSIGIVAAVAVLGLLPTGSAGASESRSLVAASARSEASTARPAVLAASSPFERPSGAGDAPASSDEPQPRSARIDRVVADLKRGPLSVDPELAWMFDERTRKALVRTLRASRIPVLVAVLPSEDEDESGGDTERVLQALQRGVARAAVYVTVDPRGAFDLASVGVDRSLEIPYSLMRPPTDDRSYDERARDPGPPGWSTVGPRLETVVRTVAEAGPGTPNRIIDDVRPLGSLERPDYRARRNREDAIAASVVGVILGGIIGLVVLGVRGGIRAARSATASGPAAPRGSGRRDAGRSTDGASGRARAGGVGRRGRRRRRGRGRRG